MVPSDFRSIYVEHNTIWIRYGFIDQAAFPFLPRVQALLISTQTTRTRHFHICTNGKSEAIWSRRTFICNCTSIIGLAPSDQLVLKLYEQTSTCFDETFIVLPKELTEITAVDSERYSKFTGTCLEFDGALSIELIS